mmetsp:Transcript_2909/g.3250  ORF Transcript_2909/g.3250 Transcript_2909/m.3250 type:complete len:338 (-) Transcript_2909:97-1110(-)
MSGASEPVELEHAWTIYYDEKKKRGVDYATFQKQMKTLGTFHTIQEFWRFWNNIALKSLPTGSNVRVFKKHIQPAWEDENNAHGGKWVVELPPRQSEKCTMVLLNLIGEQFTHSDTICGLVFSMRSKSNLLILWNSDAHASPEYYKTTEEEICKILREKGSPNITVSYKPHKVAKRKSKSNRNSEEEESFTTMTSVLNGDTGKSKNPSINIPELQVDYMKSSSGSNESSSDEGTINSARRSRSNKKSLAVPVKRTHSRSSSDDFKGRTRRHGRRLSYSQEFPRSPESQRRSLRRSFSTNHVPGRARGFIFWYLVVFFSTMIISVIGHGVYIALSEKS